MTQLAQRAIEEFLYGMLLIVCVVGLGVKVVVRLVWGPQ